MRTSRTTRASNRRWVAARRQIVHEARFVSSTAPIGSAV
jgi:hypothetical protein